MPVSQNLCYNCFAERQDTVGTCPYCGYEDNENREKYPTALRAGSILNGQYIAGRVLGQGGFGITYLALDHRLNIKVAIKEYIPDGMATRLPETTLVSVYAGEKQDNFHYGAERFLDEARVLAKFIGNKNIAGVKSYFSENNTSYFVMDYIEGISFKNYIKNKSGKVAYTDALRVLMPVMDALSAVHREGFIHRDVTPDNIYITKDNEIKLLDFGSARYSLGDKSKSLDVILKAGYAPKEQYIRRGKQGAYTDIYSLAACFYASITGYLPPEALERMEEDEIVPISTRGIKIPDSLEDAIMKGLEVRAEDRWQSVEEFKAAIEGVEVSSVSPVATDESPTVTSTPPVTINTSSVIISTGTETGTGADEHISAWQTTGQQFEPQVFESERCNTVRNIIDSGWAAERDGWVYYSNRGDDNKLYKMRIDGMDKTKLSDDWCRYINVVNGWMYYSNGNDNGKLYKMRTDGTDKTNLSDDYWCEFINVVDGWVYYRNNSKAGKLYKMRTDGKKRTKLSTDECRYINVVDGWVYYSNQNDNDKLYKIRTDGTERTKLSTDYRGGYINVVDGWVYYTTAYYSNLYKMRTDGTGRTKLSDNECSSVNVVDGWVYYSNVSDDGKLYKVRTDGTRRQLVD